jgi:serine/threonine protein kinase
MSQRADAERWRVVESLFDTALQRPPAEREGYLREACANDQDLYREVESLLANSPADDPPRAWAAAAAVHLITQPTALEPGRRVGPYEIVSFIAAGGMGEVYRARDTRLKRDVALKILPESVAADRERIVRFEREAELLASLNHQYIANIYGVEEDHGTRAIVMELVEGKTLADRIAVHPSGLPVVEALSIARQITEALQAAHEKGIVHRDLKPANVKITVGGTVKVLDFGLATAAGDSVTRENLGLATAAGDSATRENLTQRGTLVGTPRYMAPEQLAGDPTDARTDIYAAGLVLFEMLTGRPPFDAISMLARLEAILKTEPPSLPPPHARSHLNYIVRRALDRRPDARYQTAAAMVADLRAEAGTMIGSAVALRPTVRLVVLPFRLLRADEETAFLEGALPEAITASLSSVRTVLMRSNSAALRFGSSADLGQVARELDVDHVLTGTILRSGDQLRVTCQLVGAPSGDLRWSETVQVRVGDLFEVQDSLSRRIVRSLPLADSDDSTLVTQDVPAAPRAYELYLRANQLSYDRRRWTLAKNLYEQCVEVDPSYAPAWARLGRINRVIGKFDERAPRPSYQAAEANFRRALELNPELSIGHNLFAYLEAEIGRADAALLRLATRLQRQPSDPELFSALCHVSRYCGLLDVSVAAHKRTRVLDPKVPTSVPLTFMMLGDYANVLNEPRNPELSVFFAIAHRELGGSAEEALEVLSTEPSTLPLKATFEGVLRGDRAQTKAAALELYADDFPDGETVYYLARALARIGEVELATKAFARAIRSFFCVPGMDRDRWIDPLRGRPDFEAALANARERHLRTVAQFESAGGRCLIDG